MANGDAAALAGLPVVPATDDIRNGYDWINKLADKVAPLFARMTTVEKRSEPRVRAWRFNRPGTADSWPAGEFVGLVSGSIANAPAGDYLVTVTAPLAANNPAIANVRILAGGQNLSNDTRHDLDGSFQTFSFPGVVTNFAGGIFEASMAVRIGTAGVIGAVESNGTTLSVVYLGARV